ncbi:MAG: hypothetical protein JO187_11990 [Acidobacteria bacterium]|nr:hypothetical protein [Acidobacteriota bacterium]
MKAIAGSIIVLFIGGALWFHATDTTVTDIAHVLRERVPYAGRMLHAYRVAARKFADPFPTTGRLEVGGSEQSSTTAAGPSSSGSGCGSATGMNVNMNGFRPFPANDPLNTDISHARVDPYSKAQICAVDTQPPCGHNLWPHPEFGSSLSGGGIPYYVVDNSQAMVNVKLGTYDSSSDPSDTGNFPAPMPPNGAIIEGRGAGDAHAIVINKDTCWAFELYHANYNPSTNTWRADFGAVWDLLNDEQRPYDWTSADAAGLPIFPLLVRYDEAASGQINHAIRATFAISRAAYVPPATHYTTTGAGMRPPWPQMGMRMRLRAGYDITGRGKFSPVVQGILKAIQTYGVIVADNGGSGTGLMITGAPDPRWDDEMLHDQLSKVRLSDFEIVTNNPDGSPMTSYGPEGNHALPHGAGPKIRHFGAGQASVPSGGSTTLSWEAINSSYFVISPDIGPVRGNSVEVKPTHSTKYTLFATNAFGRTTASTKVKVSSKESR